MSLQFKQIPARRVKWKNVMCELCRLWIDRERVVEHRNSPLHQRMLAMQERIGEAA